MATPSNVKAEVGTIKVAMGDAKIIGADGVVRACCVGDKVYAKEIIQTAANAVVQVQLADGRMLDVGQNSQLALDEQLLGNNPVFAATPSDDVAALQAAIARGADPAAVAAAPGAGAAQGAAADSEGSHAPVVVEQANSVAAVTAGFQTAPATLAFAQAIVPLLPTALPVVSLFLVPDLPTNKPTILPPEPAPQPRNDTDSVPIGGLQTSGNVINGVGTTSGAAGADTPGVGATTVTAITFGTTTVPVTANGATITTPHGTLEIHPDGSYIFTRNPNSPLGVVDTFTYTITDANGQTGTANLVIDMGAGDGTPLLPGDTDGDGAVVSGNAASVVEGTGGPDRIVNFILSLDHPAQQDVQITYTIVPGTAQTPSDFTGPLTGTVTIPAGQTQFIVPVSIVPDHRVEPNETFNIVLSNPVNATLDPNANSAVVTIVDDDLPPNANNDAYDIVRGQPNTLPSVLTHHDPGEVADDTGAGPGETLIVVQGPKDTLLPNGDISIPTAQGGTVLMHPDGTFTYTPPANLKGPDTFDYTITDAVNGVPTGNGTSTATVTLNPANEPPTVKFNVSPAEAQVNEAGLAVGSDPTSDSEKIQGTFTIGDPDGIADIGFITINGQQIFLNDSLSGTKVTTPTGELTLTSFDAATGIVTFTYELKTPTTDVPNQPEQDLFTVTVTDKNETESAPATLTIDIKDDVPVARNDTDSVPAGTLTPISGNVITGLGTNDPVGGKDTLGADTAQLTNIASSNVPGNAPVVGPNGELTIHGAYGVLTIKPDGSYTYTRDPGTPGGVTDTFRYTLTDGDGDNVQANLAIDIGDSPVELQLQKTSVEEAGLPTGSDPTATSETTTGAINFNSKDGLQGITLDGVAVTGVPGQQIPGDHGILTVTGFVFDPVTGNGTVTYSYTLTQPTSGDTTSDPFDVVVTDKNGGSSSGKLVIDIVDDAPTARDDTDSIAAGSLDPAVGNVLTGVGTTSGTPGADTSGADVAARITTVSSTNTPGNVPTVNPDGSIVIAGQYGTLTIKPDGDYTYVRKPGSPGGVTETFRYTLTDADGDSSAANLTINIGNAEVALNVPGAQVKEEGLPTGSDPTATSETTTGAITFTAKDGLQSVTLDGVTITPPQAGQPPQTVVGDHGTLTVTGFTFDPVTGNGTITYSYTLTQPTSGDTTSDDFPVVITETDGSIGKATLTVSIVDDAPVARDDADTVPAGSFGPETGNVITGAGTTGAPGPDTKGADNAAITAITSTNSPGNAPTLNPDGSITVLGQYGVLTIKPNGDYSYTRTPGTPGDVVDIFRYTLTDGDGDASAANLTIKIGNLQGVLDVPAVEVKEAGLPARGAEPAGSDEPANSETTAGSLTFKSVDGLGSLTLDGVAVTGAGQTIPGDHGTLTVTSLVYDPVTGNGSVTYTYTLTDNTSGDTTSDDFTVVVTDKDGDSSTGNLRINIVDDVPTARPDTGAVDSGKTLTNGVAGNDTFGADGKDPAGGVVGVKAGNDTTTPVTTGTGTQIVTALGTLTLNPDGSYTYVAKPNVSGIDTFTYTIRDKDGDLSTTTLNINVTKLIVPPATGTVTVDESALPTGTNPNSPDEAGSGTLGLPPGVTVVPQADQVGAFGTLHVNPDGTFTYTLTKPDTTTPAANDGANIINGAESFTVTTTDPQGNTSTATITVNIKDDVPVITANNNTVPALTVDETDLAQNATASFANNFTNSFGADGAGAVSYALSATAVPTGLKDVATGQDIVLVNNNGVIEGHAGANGPLAFTVSVDGNGNVTLDQLRALTHPDATNPNDAVSLAAGSLVLTATSTDKDGDKAAANLNIGAAMTFKDDAPTIVAGSVTGAVEEEALPVIGNQDTNDIPNTGLVATGSLGGLALFGADGAGSFSLDGSAIASLTAQSLKSNGVALTYSIVGDTLTAKAGTEDVFTLQLSSAGNYTFTLKSHLDHAPGLDENVLNISFGNLVKVTDRDGDSVNLGGTANFAIAVQDDVPAGCPVTIIGAVDEDGLSNANADAGRAGEIASTNSAIATGSLATLASFGADGPAVGGGFSLDATALNALTAQGLTQAGVDVVYSVSGNTLTANAGIGGPAVFTLTLNSTGTYTFTLLGPLQHSTAQGENSLTLDFTRVIKITDRDGDTVSLGDASHAGPIPPKFLITVQDDIPVATDITKSTAVDVGAVTNLTLVLDVSGSMANLVTIGGQTLSRLDAEKQSAKALIDEYAALGPVKVTIVTFSDNANICKYWLDASTAKTTIDGIGAPAGNTNYAAGLDGAKAAYDGAAAHTGMLPNAQDVLYFLSDGVPNPLATGLDTPAEVAAWESFLRGSTTAGNAVGEKITAFALGMGPDVAAAQLNPIAFNGVTNTDTNAIIVSNFADLTSTLLSTVLSQPVTGNLLTDPNPDAGFGADGGWVQIVNVDGKTYMYDQKTDTTTGSTGTNGTFNTVTNQWTITTASGGKVVVDMDDGTYTYTPPANISGSKVENIGFTLTDRDGDTASANLRINVEGPTLVVGQNVNDQPGQATPHKVDPVSGTTGQIAGGGSNDVLIGDVGGGSLQGKATNVILILDTSGSMTTAFGTGLPSRLQGLKDGVNDMIESLKNSGATDVRIHINHFATDVAAGAAGAQTFDLIVNGVVQTANVTAAHGFVNGLTATGFTNYEAGLQEALTWVNGPNELTGANVTNQVVFVSDGQPNTALTGNTTTTTPAGSLSADQAIQHILGTGSGDNVSEVAQLESNFGPISAIGMGLSAADLAVLSQVEGAGGAARNTTNAAEFTNELANVSPVSSLGAVGNDLISGGAGNDIIFGDALNTDALAAARGLSLPPGSGWKVFETLEAGAGWTRADTESYIRSHQAELAAESTATGGAKRAGGNDVIDAGAGNDTVYGQEGNDIIIGGAGNDILSGGSGADTFKWGNADKGTGATPAIDTIKDFNPTTTDAANKDVLDLRDLLQGENAGNLSSYLSFSQTGADVTLSVHSAGAAGQVDQKIVLQGVTMAQLAGGHTADSAGVIANLLANNKLVTD